MRNIQETKAEIRRRGEERLVQIARNRRRRKAVCGGVALCGVMALVLTAAMTFTRTPVPLTPVAPQTTASSAATTGIVSPSKLTSTTRELPTTSSAPTSAPTETVDPMSTMSIPVTTALSTTVPTALPTTVPTALPTTVPTTLATTLPTTVSTSEATTTATKPPLFPLGSRVCIGGFEIPDLTVQEGELFEVPFITTDNFFLVDGTIEVRYDPTLIVPIVRNDDEALDPYITDISEPIFAGGAVTSSIVEEGVLRVHMERQGEPGDGQGGEMFRITFRALAPTSESHITIQVLELHGDDGESDETILVWGGQEGRLVISEKEP